ncbi:hypothetical protein [Aliiroseovarius crassostreae]|uniref:hypothetical protein n=1 Tax=Aliiroseovarius crassostreae TaxID=154981 RepID=UPI00220F0844|nr:hypothetical protein [Aliiroseovarius crassostreae]UWQ04385.1 hypothetical protein K3X22_11995 [Aliiroseovarius crassostreae]
MSELAIFAKAKEYLPDFEGLNWLSLGVILVTGGLALLLLPPPARGTGLGAIVALLVAFVAYPWQRERDRANELRKEQRADYRKFIPGWIEIDRMLVDIARGADAEPIENSLKFAEVLKKAEDLVYMIGLSGSPAVLDQVAFMHANLYKVYEHYGVSVKALYDEADRGGLPKSDIGSCLEAAIRENKGIRREAFTKMLYLMRSEEFGVSGYLETYEKLSPLEDNIEGAAI